MKNGIPVTDNLDSLYILTDLRRIIIDQALHLPIDITAVRDLLDQHIAGLSGTDDHDPVSGLMRQPVILDHPQKPVCKSGCQNQEHKNNYIYKIIASEHRHTKQIIAYKLCYCRCRTCH